MKTNWKKIGNARLLNKLESFFQATFDHRQSREPIKLEANTCSWHEARENVRERVAIGFGFTPEWPRKWREILNQSLSILNAKPKQTQSTFDTQVKTALIHVRFLQRTY